MQTLLQCAQQVCHKNACARKKVAHRQNFKIDSLCEQGCVPQNTVWQLIEEVGTACKSCKKYRVRYCAELFFRFGFGCNVLFVANFLMCVMRNFQNLPKMPTNSALFFYALDLCEKFLSAAWRRKIVQYFYKRKNFSYRLKKACVFFNKSKQFECKRLTYFAFCNKISL